MFILFFFSCMYFKWAIGTLEIICTFWWISGICIFFSCQDESLLSGSQMSPLHTHAYTQTCTKSLKILVIKCHIYNFHKWGRMYQAHIRVLANNCYILKRSRIIALAYSFSLEIILQCLQGHFTCLLLQSN